MIVVLPATLLDAVQLRASGGSSMDPQEKIFGLLALAEQQQKTVDEAIQKLEAERLALAEAQKKLIEAASHAKEVCDGLVPAMGNAAGRAVMKSVKKSLDEISDEATTSLEEASNPFIERLNGVVNAAEQLEGRFKKASHWFNWKWGALAAITAAGCIGSVVLASWGMVAWQQRQVSQLLEQREALTAEVSQLQAQANEWVKRGGRAKLQKCGDTGRLCVRVDTQAGSFGKDGEYMVLRGY
jgi:hypothetical protein